MMASEDVYVLGNDSSTSLKELDSTRQLTSLLSEDYETEYSELVDEVEIERRELSRQKHISSSLKQECEKLLSSIQKMQNLEHKKIQRMKKLEKEKAHLSAAVEEKIAERDKTKQTADRAVPLRDHIKMKLLNGFQNIDVKAIIAEVESTEYESREERIRLIQELLPPGVTLPNEMKSARPGMTRSSSMHTNIYQRRRSVARRRNSITKLPSSRTII